MRTLVTIALVLGCASALAAEMEMFQYSGAKVSGAGPGPGGAGVCCVHVAALAGRLWARSRSRSAATVPFVCSEEVRSGAHVALPPVAQVGQWTPPEPPAKESPHLQGSVPAPADERVGGSMRKLLQTEGGKVPHNWCAARAAGSACWPCEGAHRQRHAQVWSGPLQGAAVLDCHRQGGVRRVQGGACAAALCLPRAAHWGARCR